MPSIMNGYLEMLERNKKRELQKVFDLTGGNQDPSWHTLQHMEEEASRLAAQLQPMLPGRVRLNRKSVKLESYAQAQAHAKIQIKSQVSAVSSKEVIIKLHCHQIKPKGKPVKLALAIYNFSKVNAA